MYLFDDVGDKGIGCPNEVSGVSLRNPYPHVLVRKDTVVQMVWFNSYYYQYQTLR